MATFYTNPTFAYNGDGTLRTAASVTGGPGAFNTWTGQTFSSGNSYLQEPGTTATAGITCNASGTATAPIVFGSADSSSTLGYPIIQPVAGSAFTTSGSRTNITIQDLQLDTSLVAADACVFVSQSNVNNTVQRCKIRAKVGGSNYCVRFAAGASTAMSNCAVKDCIFDGGGNYAIGYLATTPALSHSGLTLTGNTITGTGSSSTGLANAIRISMESASLGTTSFSNLNVSNNTITNVPGAGIYIIPVQVVDADVTPTLWGVGLTVYNNVLTGCGNNTVQGGIYMTGWDTFAVSFNYVSNCTTSGGLIQAGRCKNGDIFENDLSYAVSNNGIDGDGIFIDSWSDQVSAKRNYCHDLPALAGVSNSGVGIATHRTTNIFICSNFIERVQQGFTFSGQNGYVISANIHYWNNTVRQASDSGIKRGANLAGVTTTSIDGKNNLFIDCLYGINPVDASVAQTNVSNNAFVNVGTAYPNGQGAGTADQVLTTTAARLGADYSPVFVSTGSGSNSPLIGAGTFVAQSFRDWNGVFFNAVPEIGSKVGTQLRPAA